MSAGAPREGAELERATGGAAEQERPLLHGAEQARSSPWPAAGGAAAVVLFLALAGAGAACLALRGAGSGADYVHLASAGADRVQVQFKSCSPDGVEQNATSDGISDFPVDVVYTWVAQPTKEEYDEMLSKCDNVMFQGWQRFRPMGTLRFSLRMIEQHIPWVRHVYLVTNGVIPDWINTNSPKLKLIEHRDIWPLDLAEHDLPVYNSQAIEAHLHRIPGLAERFVYFNDDMFVGRSLEKSFFFTDDGKPVLHRINASETAGPYSPWDEAPDAGWCSAESPGSEFGAHMAYSQSVTMIEEMQARWPDYFKKVSATRCRGLGGMTLQASPPFLYQWYASHSDQGVARRSTGSRLAWLRKEIIDGPFETWCHEQLSHPPDLGTIQDEFDSDYTTDKFKRQMQTLQDFMDNMSRGIPSTFENDGEHEETIHR